MPIKHLKPKKSSGDWKVKKIESTPKQSFATSKSSTTKSRHQRDDLSFFSKKSHKISRPTKKRRTKFNRRSSSGFKRPKNKKPILKFALIGLIFLFLLGSISALGVFAYYSKDLPDPDRLIERSIAQSTKIYDRTGEHVLYEIHGDQRRTLIDLEDLPDYVKWATITTEDRHFYQHKGFNIVAIIKGAVIDPLLGKRARGGSTLTQQLVKNAILTNERRISRKIKELILSIQIEKRFSKDQILKMYLNEIPYGSTAYGIEAASQTYLGKSASDLTLSEAATLAAMPKKPSYYMNHQDELLARRDYILDNMFSEDHISEEQRDMAKQEDVVLRSNQEGILAPHFVMYVKEILSQKYGETVAEQGGMSVYTTLDLEKQQIAEEIIAEYGEKNAQNYNASNAALVCLDANTGDILAMVGSRDYFNDEIDGQVNVTIKHRQPGSSIKPLVYAAAFQKGYTDQTILFDTETNFAASGDAYIPANYGGKTFGPVTMRKALAGSLNIPAVKTLYLTGLDEVIELAGKIGYSSLDDKDRFGLSFVLGGGEVQLIEHVSAYATFAQNGKYRKNRAILRIEDSQRRTIEETKIDDGEQVLDKNATETLNSILSDNPARAYAFGEANYLTLGNIPVAAKTGTTNDNRDGWLMGYTPSIVTGVWVGNNDNSQMADNATGSTVAAPIWNEFMKRILEDQEIEYFVKPQKADADKPVLNGQWKNEIKVRINKITGLPANDDTPDAFVEEQTYQEAHNILHYLDKDNPRGEAPENPQDDPQYSNWEVAVQEWLKEHADEIEINTPPNENNVETKNSLEVSFNSPSNNESINLDELKINISVTNNNPETSLSSVEYYLNDLYLGRTSSDNRNFNPQIYNAPQGKQSILALAYDDQKNYGSKQIQVKLSNSSYSSNKLAVAWHQNISGKEFDSGEEIYFSFSAKSPKPAESVKINLIFPDGKNKTIATSFGDKTFNKVALSYSKAIQVGQYRLWLETDSGVKSDEISFEVK